MSGEIMAADSWPTNGHLIADVARLGYLTDRMVTLDVTFGRGVFWKQWQPTTLVTMGYTADDDGAPAATIGDFRRLPFRTAAFDAVVYDPPYAPKGTPAGFAEMDKRYGVGSKGKAEIWDLMTGGLVECVRVCRPGGRIVTKAGRGVDGGKLWRGDDRLVEYGEALGMTVVAQFRMLTRPRPQSHRGPQQSPRSNYSTLTVWDNWLQAGLW